MNLPEYVNFTLDRLESNGYSAYLVGGCVRDYLMGNEPSDFDIATNALPCEIERCFGDLKTLDVGKKHGTITLVFCKECVEVTTYRIDGEYNDSRHPEKVEFTDKIELDLARRDFTINAIAFSKTYGFCDAFQGRNDIEKGIIKCVGNPNERFSEDALRILRALRFSSRLGFEIEENTARAIIEKTHLLCNISPERKTSEILGFLKGKHAKDVLIRFRSVFEFLFPSLQDKIDMGIADKLRFGLYGLFSALEGQNIAPVLKEMRLDTKTVRSVSNVILNLPSARKVKDKISSKLLAHQMGVEDALIALELSGLNEQAEMLKRLVADGECISLSQLGICGNDLKEMCSGQNLGSLLNALLLEVIEEKCQNKKEKLLQRAVEILRS